MLSFRKSMIALALGASTIVAAVPADAQWRRGWDRGWDRGGWNRGGWDRGWHRGPDRTGTAIVAGIAGLAIGAALASRDRRDPRFGYDYRYYDQRGYFPNDGRYARHYYDRYNGWDDWGGCYVRRVYDPYLDRTVRIRQCDGGW